MSVLEQHEIFEIEVLDKLKNGGVLQALVFGGGTMLRLCHEMKRFSADLAFWKITEMDNNKLFLGLQNLLSKDYEITDAQIKHYTILVEIRSSHFPKRLKIVIRREPKDCDFEQKIAYSPFSTLQVLVRAHTLRQALEYKIAALLDRGEIRDAFDIEFILRQGTPLPKIAESQKRFLMRQLDKFKPQDFKVTLGSVIDKDLRSYYIKHGFSFLKQKINQS